MTLAATAPENAALRNSATSSIGRSSRRWRRTNSAPASSPVSTHAAVVGRGPDPATCLIAYTSGTIAAIDSPADSTSNRPGRGSRDSGSSSRPETSTRTMTGT
ncbi:hypothetical protein GCM10020218_065320 [Dactylosporangium vinaceum]